MIYKHKVIVAAEGMSICCLGHISSALRNAIITRYSSSKRLYVVTGWAVMNSLQADMTSRCDVRGGTTIIQVNEPGSFTV